MFNIGKFHRGGVIIEETDFRGIPGVARKNGVEFQGGGGVVKNEIEFHGGVWFLKWLSSTGGLRKISGKAHSIPVFPGVLKGGLFVVVTLHVRGTFEQLVQILLFVEREFVLARSDVRRRRRR